MKWKLPKSEGTFKWKLQCWYNLNFEKCEHCGGRLRKDYDSGYGGIDVAKNTSGTDKETYYVCNLCYQLSKKK
jgi:hypothetical protein